MSYGLGYDTDEGRALAGAITAIMTGHSYEQSARMSKTMGPFPGYKDTRASGVKQTVDKTNAPYMLEVIEQHRDHVSRIQQSDRFASLKDEAQACWDRALDLGKKHGYRNAQGHRARADRHDRLPDGLRHHRASSRTSRW
jgi:ribonucleoside-diphosphate reductase alpha chain